MIKNKLTAIHEKKLQRIVDYEYKAKHTEYILMDLKEAQQNALEQSNKEAYIKSKVLIAVTQAKLKIVNARITIMVIIEAIASVLHIFS